MCAVGYVSILWLEKDAWNVVKLAPEPIRLVHIVHDYSHVC